MSLVVGCATQGKKSPAAQSSAGTRSESPRAQAISTKDTYYTFDAPYQVVWEAALWVLTEEEGRFLDVENMRAGVISTRWVAGDRPPPNAPEAKQERRRLFVSVQRTVTGLEFESRDDGVNITARKTAVLVTANEEIEERAPDAIRWSSAVRDQDGAAREFLGRLKRRVGELTGDHDTH